MENKELQEFENIYFIGIGGIGMSALAKYFLQIGKKVSGYDRTPSEVTQMLEKQGVEVHFEDNIECISHIYKNNKNTLVVYTPAIPKEHSEFNYFLENNFTKTLTFKAFSCIIKISIKR